MIKITRERFRESKNICGGGEHGESFQEGDESNTLPNTLEKIYLRKFSEEAAGMALALSPTN